MASYDLDRFITAQAPVFDTAMAELRAGRKRSHWMWFVFPQLRGLGMSATAQHFGIASLDEARAYLDHPVLGPRLEQATQAAIAAPAPSLHALFGSPDDLKFRSAMTLFAQVKAEPFRTALRRWCDGPDERTLSRLGL
ncbi:DUF1810 domain-containing protein [Asticcacaulis solisilvae]|uniref:DUF1810 domain-containing protein n=1 Tax=Asticcacaulis solisilvae TaxID=1217274 RepID=UPI003FD6EE7C